VIVNSWLEFWVFKDDLERLNAELKAVQSQLETDDSEEFADLIKGDDSNDEE
jgi:hypothetical protein